MLLPLTSPPASDAPAKERPGFWITLFRRRPFVWLLVVAFASNGFGSYFNIRYNRVLIVEGILNESQKDVFFRLAVPIYNLVAYPVCFALSVWLIWPLIACQRKLRAGQQVPPGDLERSRQRLINVPFCQVLINFLGWIPGAVFFPWMICTWGGPENAADIGWQFAVSFLVSALVTTVQTFFIVEWYLVTVLYRDFFQNARPADMTGVLRISFAARVFLLWLAVAVGPLVALLVIAWNGFHLSRTDHDELWRLGLGVAVVGTLFGGFIVGLVGRDLLGWMRCHAEATEQIALENFDVRIPEKRPDQFGRLTDRFNDMAAALQRGRDLRETFGEIVGPEIRDALLERYRGLEAEVQEITVFFADIRGFTRRSAGQPPERVVESLNRFLTVAGRAVKENGGVVDKFLGDGLMALFGAPDPCADHADRAVAAALDLLTRLQALNADLERHGEEPLAVGIGIHSGPALVGCIGATLLRADGRPRLRKEFTAIGETVNLGQRIEQLTKTCGGPILLSANTQARLRRHVAVVALGPQNMPGCQEPVHVYRVASE